jgi:aspartate aminotransferase
LPTAPDLSLYIKKTTLIALCSPQNPTGTIYSRSQLQAICDMNVKENNSRKEGEKKCYLLYDQMYGLLTYDNSVHYHPSALNPEMRPYTISIDAMSKSFAATGLRVGWALGPRAVLDKMKSILTSAPGHLCPSKMVWPGS